LAVGLSGIGGGAAFFAAAFGAAGGGDRLVAEAGAELVGGTGAGSCVADCPEEAAGDGAAGSALMTGGSDCAAGNATFGLGAMLVGPPDASGRPRLGQFAA
jgi:hypothetical protein